MLSWFRASGRAIAVTLLVSLAALGASLSLPHEDDCHGARCVFEALPHDPSQHAIGSGRSTAEHPLHCVICHWTRLHRPPISVATPFFAPAARHVRALARVRAIPSTLHAAQPPLRSPPRACVPSVLASV